MPLNAPRRRPPGFLRNLLEYATLQRQVSVACRWFFAFRLVLWRPDRIWYPWRLRLWLERRRASEGRKYCLRFCDTVVTNSLKDGCQLQLGPFL
jgi:hypothetical protein